MQTSFFKPQHFPILAGIAVSALMLLRVFYFFLGPDDKLISVIADDAFYYVKMAQYRSELGIWTFDGTAPATGFHFLFGYFLVLIHSLVGNLDWRTMYLLIGVLSSCSIGLSAYLTSKTSQHLFGNKVAVLSIAPFLTQAAVMQSTSMMEAWLVVTFSALCVWQITVQERPTPGGILGLFAIGLFGSLARTDYGMLPGMMFCVQAVAYRWFGSCKPHRSFLILLGAIVGVATVLIQNYFISGQLTQASAQTKLYWSMVEGHSWIPTIALSSSAALPFFSELPRYAKLPLMLALILMVGLALVTSVRQRQALQERSATVVLIGCVLTWVGYIGFYRHNSGALQMWYASNLIVPIGITLSATAFYIFKARPGVATAVGFAAYLVMLPTHLLSISWSHAPSTMTAGLFIRTQPSEYVFAGWNVGIVSYFSGRPVINLDGLTNDEILPYIKQNTLFDYIIKRKITHIVDYEAMIKLPAARRRGGYSDGRFDRCLKPGQPIANAYDRWFDSSIKVFEILPNCH